MKKQVLSLTFILFAFISSAQIIELDWAKHVGGPSYDASSAISIDHDGNIYSIGRFTGTVDFDPDGSNQFNLTSSGAADVFIQKLDSNGTFIWAKSFGGTNDDFGVSLTNDQNGNIYSAGWFFGSADFDPSSQNFTLTSNGESDAFIHKLDSNGNFVWAKSIGGINNDRANFISLDDVSNVYVVGYFDSLVDFDPNAGVHTIDSDRGKDAFVHKMGSDGNFKWVKTIRGKSGVFGRAIHCDNTGNIYTTGSFREMADFNPNAGTMNFTSEGEDDGFIQKLDTSGNFIWAKSIKGPRTVRGWAVTTDNANNVIVTGFYHDSADFDPGPDTLFLRSNGLNDLFVEKLSSAGAFIWAKTIGGPLYETAYSVATDQFDNVYCSGIFRDTVDFDPGTDTNFLYGNGDNEIYALKLNKSGEFEWAIAVGGSFGDQGRGIAIDASNRVYVTGHFRDTVDFDPTTGNEEIISNGDADCYVIRLTQKITGGIDIDPIEKVVIYPNPSNGTINVTLGNLKDVSIQCYSLTGNLIYRKEKINSSTHQFKLNTIPGIYLIEIHSNGKKVFYKLVKTH
jgi:hypothetical protein